MRRKFIIASICAVFLGVAATWRGSLAEVCIWSSTLRGVVLQNSRDIDLKNTIIRKAGRIDGDPAYRILAEVYASISRDYEAGGHYDVGFSPKPSKLLRGAFGGYVNVNGLDALKAEESRFNELFERLSEREVKP